MQFEITNICLVRIGVLSLPHMWNIICTQNHCDETKPKVQLWTEARTQENYKNTTESPTTDTQKENKKTKLTAFEEFNHNANTITQTQTASKVDSRVAGDKNTGITSKWSVS